MQNEDELLSVNLRDPLAVEFPKHICNLLLNNKTLLKKYGISLGSSKENTLLIRTIPQCLITSNDHTVSEKVLPKIYSLLLDILKNRNTTHHANTLPLTIHNAIASEACHGTYRAYFINGVYNCYELLSSHLKSVHRLNDSCYILSQY